MADDGMREALRRIRKAREGGAAKLSLSALGLAELPEELWELQDLQILNLDSNELTAVPESLGLLRNLKELRLSSNQLTAVPKWLSQLQSLQELVVESNQLTAVPESLGLLQNLRGLWLYSNQLTALPESLGLLRNLRSLSIASNELTAVPESLGLLQNLQILDLDSNGLRELPWQLGRLEKLAETRLAGNSAHLDLLQGLASASMDRFRAYLLSLEHATRLYEAKLLLVGEGAVGKSTLLAALRDEEFKEHRESTHGIEVRVVELPHPILSDTHLELRGWDFGGQPFYRISHQFFYSRRAIYLVLWEPRRGFEGCEVEEWIERIRLRVGDEARILIVATHAADGRVARIDKKRLLRDYGDVIVDFFEVDSQDGRGISGLQEALAQAAAELPQMGDPFSPDWQALRDELRELDQPRLPYSQVLTLANKHALEEIEVETLLALLHDVGDLIYFADDDSLKEEVILNPEWLPKALSLVLEDRQTNEEAGILDHRRLDEVWQHHGKDQPTYEPALHPFLIRLMEKYDASYRLEGGEKSLVAQLVPEVQPEDLPWTPEDPLPESDNEVGRVTLLCNMQEVPPGLVPWLIVRTHRYSTGPTRHWQRGTFLQYKTHGEGHLELRDRDLILTVQASWPQHFMDLLHDTVRVLLERWPGLVHDYLVPCLTVENGRQCAGTFRLEGLRKFKRKGKSTIDCQVCAEELNIDQLLLGFRSEDEVLAEIQAMRQEARSEASAAARERRALLRALAAENNQCPRTFTLLPEGDRGWNLGSTGKLRHRLTLWCEHPDKSHPCCPIGSGSMDDHQGDRGEYLFETSKEWLTQVVPLANAVAKTLKYTVPVAGALVADGLEEVLLKDVTPKLDLMETLTLRVLQEVPQPEDSPRPQGKPGAHELADEATGAALRQMHQLLLKLDPQRTWGHLRRILTTSGDYLWLCPHHYEEFEPGLPKIPPGDD